MKVDAFAELKMADFGDAPVVPGDAARSHQAIEATVGQVLAAGAIPIVLGGDHSIALGTVTGLARHFRRKGREFGLLYVDAHGDMNTPESSPSTQRAWSATRRANLAFASALS